MVAIDALLAIAGVLRCWLVSGTEHLISMLPQLLICVQPPHRCLRFLETVSSHTTRRMKPHT